MALIGVDQTRQSIISALIALMSLVVGVGNRAGTQAAVN
jgi:hypothetical protein